MGKWALNNTIDGSGAGSSPGLGGALMHAIDRQEMMQSLMGGAVQQWDVK